MIRDTIKWALMGFFIVIVGLIVFFFLSVDSVFAEGIACTISNTSTNLKMTRVDGTTSTSNVGLNQYYGTNPNASSFDDYVVGYELFTTTTLADGENWTLSIQLKTYSVSDSLPHLTKNNFGLFWGNSQGSITNRINLSDDTFSFEENGWGIDTNNSNKYTYTYTINMQFGFSNPHYVKLVYIPNSGNGVNQGISFNSICFYNDESPRDSTSQIIENNNQNTTNIINNNNYNSEKERQAINNNTDAVNSVNNSINDSSVDNPALDLNSMKSAFEDDDTISSLLLLPVTLFQKIINAKSGTCQPISLGSLYGTNLTLPCINPANYISAGLWYFIDFMLCFGFILAIRKRFISIFNNFTNLRSGGNELE